MQESHRGPASSEMFVFCHGLAVSKPHDFVTAVWERILSAL